MLNVLKCSGVIFLLGMAPLRAEIEIVFPEPAVSFYRYQQPMVYREGVDPVRRFKSPWKGPEKRQAVYKDDMLICHKVPSFGYTAVVPDFDGIKEGMTAREIITNLGPGSQDQQGGQSTILWKAKDYNGVLQLRYPANLDDAANYVVLLRGSNQKHNKVEALIKKRIRGINFTENQAIVTTAIDTLHSKAHQTTTLKVGDTFLEIDALPRLALKIQKIQNGQAHCRYYFQSEKKGVTYFRDNGNIILSDADE